MKLAEEADGLHAHILMLEDELQKLGKELQSLNAECDQKSNIVRQKQIRQEISIINTRLQQFEPAKAPQEGVIGEFISTESHEPPLPLKPVSEQQLQEAGRGRTMAFGVPNGLFSGLKPEQEDADKEGPNQEGGEPVKNPEATPREYVLLVGGEVETIPTSGSDKEHPFHEVPQELSLLKWHNFRSKLPIEIVGVLQALFKDSEKLDYVLKQYFPMISWLTLSAIISECSRRVPDDQISSLLSIVKNKQGRWHEFPADQILSLRKKYGLGEPALCQKGPERYRQEFIVRYYLFEGFSGFEAQNIADQIEAKWSELGGDIYKLIEVCENQFKSHGRPIPRANFDAKKFLNVCLEIRNLNAHLWRRAPFNHFDPKEFERVCFSAFKKAFLEFLYEESWMWNLAIASFFQKGEQGEVLFMLDRQGNHLLEIKELGPCGAEDLNDHIEWLVDPAQGHVLFEFKRFGLADKQYVKKSGLIKETES